MSYKNKMKKKIWVFAIYFIVGAALLIFAFVTKADNGYLTSFGAALICASAARIVQYSIILKNDDKLKAYETATHDERNIMISNKAKSAAFAIFIIAAACAVAVLAVLNMYDMMIAIAYSVCALVIIYWICYHIIKRMY